MPERFLLYVDVLGFAELSASEPRRVDDLFEIIASLNLFKHEGFAATAFSDTVLVHEAAELSGDYDRHYVVMYLCEFFKDLLHRTAGRQLSFRAVLTAGEFEHYRLNDVPFFYGPALIRAYGAEKRLPVTGLLMDHTCEKYSDIFSTRPFDQDWHFTFVTQALDEYEDTYGGMTPLPVEVLDSTDLCWLLGPELEILAHSAKLARDHDDPRVRSKHLLTLDQYRQRYPGVFASLEREGFQMEAVNPEHDWTPVRERMRENYGWGSKREPARRGGWTKPGDV